MLAGQYDSLTEFEWMRAGYVVDMPLSKEGGLENSFCSKRARLRRDLIFITYLFHMEALSSRAWPCFIQDIMVAIVFLKGAPTTNTAELGYLRRTLVAKDSSSLAAGWTYNHWSDKVKPKFQVPSAAMEYTSSSTRVLKLRGEAYHRKIVSLLKCDQMKTQLLMLNPTPPKTVILQLPRPTDKDDILNNKRQNTGQEDGGLPPKHARSQLKAPPASSQANHQEPPTLALQSKEQYFL